MDTPLALLQGTLDVLTLQTLSWQPTYGYGVSRWIRAVTRRAGRRGRRALSGMAPAERRGWIQSAWCLSDTNRRAKYYELTEMGRGQLTTEAATWRRYVGAIGAVLDASPLEPV